MVAVAGNDRQYFSRRDYPAGVARFLSRRTRRSYPSLEISAYRARGRGKKTETERERERERGGEGCWKGPKRGLRSPLCSPRTIRLRRECSLSLSLSLSLFVFSLGSISFRASLPLRPVRSATISAQRARIDASAGILIRDRGFTGS